jgi:hypothetical protein
LFVSSVSRESLLTVNDLSMSVIQTIAATTMIFNTLSRPWPVVKMLKPSSKYTCITPVSPVAIISGTLMREKPRTA